MNSPSAEKLALGTAQFGLTYGVANQSGQVRAADVREILTYARATGVHTLDTAIGYGNSEDVLGNAGVDDWQVITKLSPIPESCGDIEGWVNQQIKASLQRLNISQLEGLLLHQPAQLLGASGSAIYNALTTARDQQLVRKVGISIYEPTELEAIWPLHSDWDVVQAPFNVFDRRLGDTGWLTRLADSGVEVHTRSAFLQGLLLMPSKDIPAQFGKWSTLWHDWESWLGDIGISALQACLNFALSTPQVSKVIVGVDSLPQLQGIIAAIDEEIASPPAHIQCDDVALINPANWSTP